MVNAHPAFKNNLSWGQLDTKNKKIAASKKGQVRNQDKPHLGLLYHIKSLAQGPASSSGDGVPGVVLIERRELPAFTYGSWKKGELPICVCGPFPGFRAKTKGTIKLVSFGVTAGELLFGRNNEFARLLGTQARKAFNGEFGKTLIGKALRKATWIEPRARVVPIDCRKLRDPSPIEKASGISSRNHRRRGAAPYVC